MQRPSKTKITSKKNKVERFIWTGFKTYYKAQVNKSIIGVNKGMKINGTELRKKSFYLWLINFQQRYQHNSMMKEFIYK